MTTMPPAFAISSLRSGLWSFQVLLVAFQLSVVVILSPVPAIAAAFSSSAASTVPISRGTTNSTGHTSTPTVTPRHPKIHHFLTSDFYRQTCPQLDQLVSSVTTRRFHDYPASGPATIRLFFHDCFVEGCDASILVEPQQGGGPGNGQQLQAGAAARVMVERDMGDNRNLRDAAFETVAEAKAEVEAKCPGIVSCSDVLAVAARDFVHLAGGPFYDVKKGRRDSKVSLPHKVPYNLPRSNSTVDDLIRLFARKGLSVLDLVALSGAHTIGFSHCDQFVGRLYDHKGTGNPDPAIDPRLLKALRMSCPKTGGNQDVVAPFDVQTPFSFDQQYFGNLEAKLGLLATDQALFADPRTKPIVQELGRDKAKFFKAFADGMEKMGGIGVKRGRKGEVRKVCTRFNSNKWS